MSDVEKVAEVTPEVENTAADVPAEETKAEETTGADEPELSEVKKAALEKKVIDLGGGAVACVECEKKCFMAEAVYMEQLPRHKECFKCSKCDKKIDNTVNANIFDHKLLCKTCFTAGGYNRLQAKVKWTPKSSGSTAASGVFAKLGGGGVKCSLESCGKTVYPAELVQYNGKVYHGTCLNCSKCAAKCTLNTINEFDNELLCMGCWNSGGYARKQAALKSSGSGSTAKAPVNPIFAKLGGGAVKCTLCEKSVYPAEQVNFNTKPYHGTCIQCTDCNTKTHVNNINEFENRLICGKCWGVGGYARKQLAQPSHGSGAKAPVNPAFAKLGGGSVKCHLCEKSVYPAEQVNYNGKVFHGNCIVCADCNTKTHVNNINEFEDRLICGKCWGVGQYARKQLGI
jgi:cysteine/glycine-rich protein